MLNQDFNTQMSRLMALYGSQKPEVVAEYWRVLKHIDATQFTGIVDSVIQQYDPMAKKFPRIPYILSFKTQSTEEIEVDSWNPPENEKATFGDIAAFFKVLDEIGNWIDAKLESYKTIYSNFEKGLELHYDKPTFEKYCQEYESLLRKNRHERIRG